jgi:hypothetical protein
MMPAFLGLVALGLFWVGALCALAWSWNRYLQRALAANIQISDQHRGFKLSTVLWGNIRSHTIGWSAFYFFFFLLLGLASFPTWQRLGISFVLALYYGYLRESRETGKHRDRLTLFSPRADRVWYFTVLSAEWFGYYGVLVFAGQLVLEAVK